MTDSLPPTWTVTSLGDICVKKVPQGPPTRDHVSYIDISSIERTTKRIGETRLVTIQDAPTRARQWVRAKDVLVSMTRPNLNAVAQVHEDLDGAVASTGFDVLRPVNIVPEWVFYRVRTNEFIEDVCKDLQGVVYPAIRPHDVRRHKLPVPPVGEQHRIVEAIESYFTRLDDAVATLERVQRNLKRYRASVLKAAVEGRLVPTEPELARRVEAASRRFVEATSRRFVEATSRRFVEATSRRFVEATSRRFVEATSRRFIERSSASEIPEVPPPTRRDAASTSPCFFDRDEGVITKRGNLPHWHQPGRTCFVTFRLADSLPAAVAERIRQERQRWLRDNPEPHTPRQRAQYYRLFSRQLDDKLDAGLGSCVLRQVEVRNIVREALYHFDGERYFLHDWVIMPNHVHVLLTLREANDLSQVLHSIKSFSAKAINRLLGRSGQLWQKESFDHIVRSAESFVRLRRYLADNPRRLADGEFSLGQEVAGWDEESVTRRDAASTYEPASVLLERILAERRRRWEETELAKMTAKGKPPKDDKWKAKYVEPVAPDTSDLPGLPEGWCWASMDSLVLVIEAGKNFKCDERPPNAGEHGVVKVSAVTWGIFDEEESKTCRRKDQLRAEHLIQCGDLLISRANTVELVGACVIVGDVRRSLMLSDKILRLRLVEPGWAGWLLWVLRSSWGRAEIEALATGNQESMRNISQASIRSIRVPIPPAFAAKRLVAEISTAMDASERLTVFAESSSRRLARLRQSILKWAFEGRLVDQDPTDEPASALLERIRAERASATTKQAARSGPRKARSTAP